MDAFTRHCHGTLAEWLKYDPVLAKGEMVLVATDPTKPDEYNCRKVGDGIRKFSQLPLLGFDCLPSTGESLTQPMSQKATTEAIATGAQAIITQELTEEENTVPSNAAIKGTITSEITNDPDKVPSNATLWKRFYAVNSASTETAIVTEREDGYYDLSGNWVDEEGTCTAVLPFSRRGAIPLFVYGVTLVHNILHYDEDDGLLYAFSVKNTLSVTGLGQWCYQLNPRGDEADKTAYVRISFVKRIDSPIYSGSCSILRRLTNDIGLRSRENPIGIAQDGFYLDSNGVAHENSVYGVTDFLEFAYGSPYIYMRVNPDAKVIGGASVCYYDVDKALLYGFPSQDTANIQEIGDGIYLIKRRGGTTGAAYVRISISGFREGVYSDKCMQRVTVGDLTGDLAEEIKARKSLFQCPLVKRTENSYYDADGELRADGNGFYECAVFDVSGCSRIDIFQTFSGGALPPDMCPAVLVGDDGELLGTVDDYDRHYDMDTANSKYLYVSYRNVKMPIVAVAQETTLPSINAVFSGVLEDAGAYRQFGYYNFVKKNTNLCVLCRVLSSFTSVTVRRGNGLYFSDYVKITANRVTTKNGGDATLTNELSEGDVIRIEIHSDKMNICSVRITKLSDTGEQQETVDTGVIFYADGVCDMASDGLEVYSAQFIVEDAHCGIRYYGDSFSNTSSPARSVYQLAKLGCDIFVNGLTGGTSRVLLRQVISDIAMYGKPDIIIWALGMNDDNATWKNVLTGIKYYCDVYGIRLVPCTIPNVPTRDHTAKTSYVRENFKNYIDQSKAVDADAEGATWAVGALSSDNVHPTVYGANLLALQALSDCPELL